MTQHALEHMQAGEYARAERLWVEVLEQQPGHAASLYNLACCLSRLGEQPRAAEQLEAAWRSGFRDLHFIHADPDLADLRASRAGRRLLSRLADEDARMQRLVGELIPVVAEVLSGARVVAPDTVEPDRRYPLILALHGAGGSPEFLAGVFLAAGVDQEFFVCAPYGPYPVAQARGLGHVWYPPPRLRPAPAAGAAGEERVEPVLRSHQELSETYVLAALDAVIRSHPVDPDRVVLLGHSQGGFLAYHLALRHPDRFRGVVVIGSRMLDQDFSGAELELASDQLRFLLCHSPDDQVIPLDGARQAAEFLGSKGVEAKLLAYDGGHQITAELLRRIARWTHRTWGAD
jgi:phospholipase/carboxylesterase